MKEKQARGPRVLVWASVLLVLPLALVTAIVAGRREHRAKRANVDELASAETSAPSAGARPAASPRPMSVSPPLDDSDERRAKSQREAKNLLDVTRFQLLNSPQYQDLGVEAAGNAMVPYLMGMLATLRNVNPSLIGDLRDALAERTCSTSPSDAELMMVAHLIMTDAELGSRRTLECALRRHKTEDVVLWTMLDAWKATGRPPIQSVNELGASASDARTTRRLSDPEKGRQDRIAEANAAFERMNDRPEESRKDTENANVQR
jgi:hypothetical protein